MKDNVTTAYFDANGLDIERVEVNGPFSMHNVIKWRDANYTVSTPNPNIGDAVAIDLKPFLPSNCTGKIFYIRFYYRTNEKQNAATWLRPE